MLTRLQIRFLAVVGLFNLVVWPRFAVAIVKDDRAWSGERWASTPTSFLWVHAVLIGTATLLALGTLWVTWRAHRSAPSA